jgi:hypothetical protein
MTGVPAEHLGVSDQVAMDGSRQLNGKLDRLVVRNGGELQVRHRVSVQFW